MLSQQDRSLLSYLQALSVFRIVGLVLLAFDTDVNLAVVGSWVVIECVAVACGTIMWRRGSDCCYWQYISYQLVNAVLYLFFGCLLLAVGALVDYDEASEYVLRTLLGDESGRNPALPWISIASGAAALSNVLAVIWLVTAVVSTW